MKVALFIPIKLNNQRLPGKNIIDLNGRPLCDYVFKMALSLDSVDEKYVFCSDEKIKEYLPCGLSFLQRDKWLDGFEVKGLDIIDSFVNTVDADIYVLTHVTQPFTKAESIDNALKKVMYEDYDSAFSAVCLKDYIWYKGKPLNYELSDVVRTQDMEPVYMETGAFFIFKKEVFTKMHRRIGIKPYIYEIDQFEAIDIDEQEDLDFAKVVAQYLYND